eukprot:g29285.t1
MHKSGRRRVIRTSLGHNAMASLLAAYSSWLQRRPLTTKGISAGLLFSLGDWLAQKLESGGASPDLQRLAAFGSFGASWYAISQHYCPTRAALARVVTHSAVYAPFSIVSLFAWMGWAHGESSEELLAHCHPEAVFGVWAAGTVFWIPTMLAVYRFVPLHGRVVVTSGANRPSCDCELGDLVALQSHGGGGPLMLPSVAVGTWSWGNESFGLGTQRDPEDPEGPGASALIGKAQSHTVSKTEPLARRHGLRPGSRGAKEAARATFDAAIRHGSYFFDTAPTYGRGFAEESLGHLCHHGPYAVVATKHFPRPQQDLTAALLSTAREARCSG